MTFTRIKFPVLKKLIVDKYQLFPGSSKTGLTHEFLPGITVIAGINGLGKTTLLNIILRLLTGTQEPKKFDPYDPGGGVHEMVTKDVDSFAQRVLDHAAEATATGEFSFGSNAVRIERSLKDLSIVSLKINGKVQTGDDDVLQQVLVKLSGAADEYDFFYIVRSFTFFLEDKVSLIWNPKGQFEIFRILFFELIEAKKFAALQDEVQRIDSDFRNRRANLNKRKRELRGAFERTAKSGNAVAKVAKLESEAVVLREQRNAHTKQEEQLIDRKTKLTISREKLHLSLEEAMREVESLVEDYFFTAFPTLPDTVKLLLVQLASREGCLVCGNDSPKYPAQFRDLAKQGICPFCQTDTTKQAATVPLRHVRAEQVNQAETRLQGLRDARIRLDRELMTADKDLARQRDRQRQSYEASLAVETQLEVVRASLPLNEKQYETELAKLKPEDEALDDLNEKLRSRRASFEKLLNQASGLIKTVTAKLSNRFAFYAGEFLAEECKLAWEPSQQRVGQEGEPFMFPSFTIYMTSAVSTASPTARDSETAVSESQKEFIDLAFRMALFDVVTEHKIGVMLVIETPESSLDSMFVSKAGLLLRKFADGHGQIKNTVIATCNLNRENMVRALLGLDEKLSAATKAEIPKRVINLLTEAAPNAALRQNEKFYHNELALALSVP